MPWDCKQCNTHVESDNEVACPQCGTRKGLWTLAGGRTRTFRVATKKVELLFGSGRDPRPAAQGWPAEKLLAAERAVAVQKGVAKGWAAQGALPPSEQVLVVRCWSGDPEVEVRLTLEFAAQEVQELPPFTWKAPRQEGGKPCHDARYLFVYGDGDVDGLEFPGVEVVDVSEAGALGHVPRVGVAAMGSKRRTVLPLDRFQKGWAQRLQCQELEFNHDSHLLLPDGLSVLHLVLEHAKAHADLRLVLAGHTDATGSDERNDVLARDRCANILHMLEGDRDAWAESALQSYLHLLKTDASKAQRDATFVEDWVGRPAGAANDAEWAGFKGFARRHQLEFKKSGLTLDPEKGWKDLASWKAVFDFYDDALLDHVASPLLPAKVRQEAAKKTTDAARLSYLQVERNKHEAARRETLKTLRASLKWVDPARKTVGCGERYLKVKTQTKALTNRRDEFLFFTKDRLPWDPASPPADEAGAREALYGTGGKAWDYQNNDGPWTFDALDCPAPPAIEVPPGDVLLVIDVSGSMDAIDPVEKKKPSPRPRIEVCKDRLLETLRAIPSDRRFGLIAFGKTVTPWRPTLSPASRMTKHAAYTWVEGLKALNENGPNTFTSGALEHALTKVEDVDSVVLLSDGSPTVGTQNERTILMVVETRWNPGKKRRIDTYGFLEGQGLVDPATRTKVNQAYEAILKDTPIVGAGGVERDKLLMQVAATLKAQGVKSSKGAPLTAGEVGQVILGWFLEELAGRNRGEFKDLNTLAD